MKLARASYWAGAISAAGGAFMILQWLLPPSWLPAGLIDPLFAPVIAASFVMIGSVLMAAEQRSRAVQRATRAVAVLLALVACTRLAMEFVWLPSLQTIFPLNPNQPRATAIGYLSALTAVQVLLTAAGLAILSWRGRFQAAEGFAASLGIAVCFIGLGYVIRFFLGGQSEGAPFLDAVLRSSIFLLIGLGLFCAAADRGATMLAAGTAARELSPEVKLSVSSGTTLGIGILVGMLCLGLLVRFAEDDRYHLQITRIAAVLNRIDYSAQAATLAVNTYVETGRASDLSPYDRSLKDLDAELTFVAKQPLSRQQRLVADGIVRAVRAHLSMLQHAIERQTPNSIGDFQPDTTAVQRIALLNAVSDQIALAERELQHDLDRRAGLRASSRTRTQVFFLCSLLGIGTILFGVHVLFERDLAARRRADAALSRHNETLRSFAHTVAHDLRAPLRGIQGYARELERHASGLDSRSRFCVAQIGGAAVSLERLIEDTLDYARLDAEPLQLAEIDLPALVASLLRERAPQIDEYHAEITTRLELARLFGWERGLRQVLGNLLDNALKYSRHSHPPRIRIESTETPLAWRLAVRDNGVGFDMKHHERIFGLFQRLVTTPEFEGTGAGLAIVRKITDRLGGKVTADSTPGDGASFVVELPKTPLPSAVAPSA